MVNNVYVLIELARYFLWKFFSCMALQSKQVKRTPQDSINELIIWKTNPLVVVPVNSVKFKSELLHV